MAVTYEQLGLDSLLDDGTLFGTLLRRFYPLLLRQAYGDAETLLGVDIAFDLSNPAVQRVLNDLALLVKDIAETTREDIRALISQQADEGWSINELAQALREQGFTQSQYRSELIARSETARAYSLGSKLAYQESGVVDGVTWLTADEACPICEPLNGTVAPLDGTFADGIDHPPAHPACRCAIAPRLTA